MDKLWTIYAELIKQNDGVDVTNNANVQYTKKDIDYYLMSEQDIAYFCNIDPDFHIVPTLPKTSKTGKSQTEYTKWFKSEFPEHYPSLGWMSLHNKGKLMVETFLADILPLIKGVVSVQNREDIDNGEGDTLTIIADFICTLDGNLVNNSDLIHCPTILEDRDYVVLVDNKTTSMKYKDDSVCTSAQLATYDEFFDNELCAYIALEKEIRKDKKIRWQFVVDRIPTKFQEEIFDNFQEGLYNMKQEVYEKNTESCYSYGRRCDYYSLCHHGDMGNLKKRVYRK